MLNINQFRELIVKPSLYLINAWSEDAEELLVFTCAVESLGGTYVQQINGPAHGIYQMEQETHNDIWQNYIMGHNPLLTMLSTNLGISQMQWANRMIYDLQYATVMARIHYLRVKAPLPKHDDMFAVWDYYKEHWNSCLGKATETLSLIKYHNFIQTHLDNS